MINRQHLLKELQALLPKLEKDILAYSESKAELTAHLHDEHAKTVAAGRSAEHFWTGGKRRLHRRRWPGC